MINLMIHFGLAVTYLIEELDLLRLVPGRTIRIYGWIELAELNLAHLLDS
jgi:hypothetical protein